MNNGHILKLLGITKRFGGIVAVNNVTTFFDRNALIAIIGPNGSGKTTLFNLISGVIPVDSGTIIFESVDITRFPPYRRAQLGIARSFQTINIFPNHTVLDNIRLALLKTKSFKAYNLLHTLDRHQDLYEEAYEILRKVGLKGKEFIPARALTQADQRKLDIGIALALSVKPKLLLLDEPTSGLTLDEIYSIVSLIKSLRTSENDLTIVVVEHKIEVVSKIADRVIVMHEGKIIADGPPQEILNNEMVLDIYLGGSGARG